MLERIVICGFTIEDRDILSFLKTNFKKYNPDINWCDQLKEYVGEKYFDKYFFTEYEDYIYFGVIKIRNILQDCELDLSDISNNMVKMLTIKKLNLLFLFLTEKQIKEKIIILA